MLIPGIAGAIANYLRTKPKAKVVEPGTVEPAVDREEGSMPIDRGYYDNQVIREGNVFKVVEFTPNGVPYFHEVPEATAAKIANDNLQKLQKQYDVGVSYSGTVPIVTINQTPQGGYVSPTKQPDEYPDPEPFVPKVDVSELTSAPMEKLPASPQSSAGTYSIPNMNETAEKKRIMESIKKRTEQVPEYQYNLDMPAMPQIKAGSKNNPQSAAISRALAR